MKADRVTKAVLWIIAMLLFLNLAHSLLTSKPALAVGGSEDIGRYQISAWAAQAGAYTHHSGYYVIDTTTGKIVDSKAEVHRQGE